MHHKNFLLTAIITAAALAIAVSTIVFGRNFSGEPKPEKSLTSHAKEPLEETSGEVASTLPLFQRVDDSYARGSQPARGGIGTLKRLGVKTLVDLRSIYDHTDDVRAAAEIAGLRYVWMPMSVWDPPTDQEANQFLSVVNDTTKGPFFVFCADGLNRTGEMTAIYRVVHSNWSVQQALDEADKLGFNPYYYTLRNYVWDYARKFRPSAVPRAARRVTPAEL